MKLKSLILGSVAAAGLSTAGYAADLGVLTSLDVCDALGLSGLTISSDTNCLQITGGVEYLFEWGDYKGEYAVAGGPLAVSLLGTRNVMDNDTDPVTGLEADWESQVTAWLRFVGTADSDFGPAKAVLKIRDTNGFEYQEAYVSIGDSTVIMAGKKGSIANFGDDEPFNFTGLFGNSWADSGVKWDIDRPGGINMGDLDTGGHVIQVVSDLGNGVSVGVGLENLNDGIPAMAGTLVGVLSYAGEGITAHVTGLAGGILDGTVDAYAVHAGFTGTFDMFRLRGSVAANHDTWSDITAWHANASAAATFDMFTLAVSGEALGADDLPNTDFGVGGSIGATVTDGVAINLGGRYYQDNNGGISGYQVAAQLVAAVTESITLTGEVGVYGTTEPVDTSDIYGAAELAWAPGGGFTSSLKGEAHENGAYKVTFKAAKTFE
jgi:hypothetical protein